MYNIVLCGFMGAGKTVVGKELSKITGRKFVDTDDLVVEKQGIAIPAIFAAYGEDFFRDLEYAVCLDAGKMKNTIISTGGGTVTFERNVTALKQNSRIVFLDASFEVICERVGNPETRPMFKDKENALHLYNERHEKYVTAADFIVNGDMSARKTAAEIAKICEI